MSVSIIIIIFNKVINIFSFIYRGEVSKLLFPQTGSSSKRRPVTIMVINIGWNPIGPTRFSLTLKMSGGSIMDFLTNPEYPKLFEI